MSKQRVIRQLLRANRPDLANALAYHVTAELILPPRKIKPFVEKLVKQLRELGRDVKAFRAWFDNTNRQFRDSSGYEYNPFESFRVIRQGGYGGPYGSSDIEYLLETLERKDFGSSKPRYTESADTIEQTWKLLQGWDSARDQLNGVGYLAADMERASEAFNSMLNNAEDFLRRGWVDDTFEAYQVQYGEDYPVLVRKKDLIALDRIIQRAVKLKADLKTASIRLAHMKSAALQRYNDPNWKPESEEIETLYHASVQAARIYQQRAFDPKAPGGKGLGGSTLDKKNNPAISFTSDLYVAKEIARALKEVIMIARGELTADDILDWSRRHGIYQDVDRSFKTAYGQLDPKKPVHVAKLHQIYLMFHRTRYNPVFFGIDGADMRYFRRQKVSDVGVLKCRVNMSDPAISYHAAEHEYRVQPASVVSIDKLIK